MSVLAVSLQRLVSFLVAFSLLTGSVGIIPSPAPTTSLSRGHRSQLAEKEILFRTRVQLRQPIDLARVTGMAVHVLTTGEDWALLVVDETQLADLARLGFQPRQTDTLSQLGFMRSSLSNSELLAALIATPIADADGDGLTDTEEGWWCTDPNDSNSDSPNPPSPTNPSDGEEVAAILDGVTDFGPPFALWPQFTPDNPEGDCQDGDADSVPDFAEELVIGLNWLAESTDGDKYDDGQELFGVTFCPGGAGGCDYGARPRTIDDWLGAELPTWIRPPGDSPFVAAYPVIEFVVDPDTIIIVTNEINTTERTILEGEEVSIGFAETQGNSTTVGTIDTNTHNTWQEVSTTEGGIIPVLTGKNESARILPAGSTFFPRPGNLALQQENQTNLEMNIGEEHLCRISVSDLTSSNSATKTEHSICQAIFQSLFGDSGNKKPLLNEDQEMVVTEISLFHSSGTDFLQAWIRTIIQSKVQTEYGTDSEWQAIATHQPAGWNVAFIGSEEFRLQLDEVPESLVSSQMKERLEASYLPPLPQPSGTHFYLPWTKGDSYPVTQQAPDHPLAWAWDFGMPKETLLRASRSGIAYAYDGYTGCGMTDFYLNRSNFVLIDHLDGTASLYLHLEPGRALVGKDTNGYPTAMQVQVGEPIGYSGNQGYTNCQSPQEGGYHLHFQVQSWVSGATPQIMPDGESNVFITPTYQIHFEEYPGLDVLPSPAKSENPQAEPFNNESCSAHGVISGDLPGNSELNEQPKPMGFSEIIGQLWDGFTGFLGFNIQIGSDKSPLSGWHPGCEENSCLNQVGGESEPLNFSDYRSGGQCGGGFYTYADTYGIGGGGAGFGVNDNGDGTFDYLRVWSETTTSGEGFSTSHSELRSETTYSEITRSEVNTLVSSEAWTTATAINPAEAAYLTFNYSLRNRGSDLAVNITQMAMNILIGDLPVITWNAPDRSDVEPGQTIGPFGSNSITLSLDQLAAIDNGAPIRIVLADYDYDDDLYEVDAWGRSVLFHVDDGIADGDRIVDTYLIATGIVVSETYQQTLARYFDIDVFDAGPGDPRTGTITNIRTPEYDSNGYISHWVDHPVGENAWWELSISAGGETEGIEHFKDMPAKPITDVSLRYVVDSDGDGYTDRAELDTNSDPENPQIHPRPLMIAAQHTTVVSNMATVQLSLQNNGNYDASSVEVWAIAPDDTITITDNLIGGGGRVRAGSRIVLGALISAPELTNWASGTAKPYLSGQFEGTTPKIYTFRADTGGTVGNTPGLTVSWSEDGGNWTPLNVGNGYNPLDVLPVVDGIKIAFTPGDINAGETFTVETALPIDTFTYTINDPLNYTPPLIVVSYNDAQGNHKFASDVEVAQIQDDLTPYQGSMSHGMEMSIVSASPVVSGTNTAHIILQNPSNTTISEGKLFVEFALPDGTVAKEYVLPEQAFLPGPNVVAFDWHTDDFLPVFEPENNYQILVFATDRQGTIFENTVKDIRDLGRDTLAVVAMSSPSWDFGVVTQGETPETTITIANTGIAPLRAYVASDSNAMALATSPALTIPPAEFRTIDLKLDTANVPAGTFSAELVVRTNDISKPTITIPVLGVVEELNEDALAYSASPYRPWDQYVYIPGPHDPNETVTFDHTIADDLDQMHPLYLYTQDHNTLLGIGEFGPDFTGQTAPYGIFGDGADGDLVWGPGNSFSFCNDPVAPCTVLTSNANAGQKVLYVTDVSSFYPRKEVLIIQMQGSGVGQYEFGEIASINGSAFTLVTNLQHTYSVDGNSRAQVIGIPHWRNVTILNGGVFNVGAWGGTGRGSVIVIRVSEMLTVEAGGFLAASGTGYRGGILVNGAGNYTGYQGEGIFGGGGQICATNGNGGGAGGGFAGGVGSANSGAGGGSGAFGANGGVSNGICQGLGGVPGGNSDLTSAVLGGGGGSGGSRNLGPQETSGAGGNGGGVIFVFAKSIMTSGSITVDGSNGGDSSRDGFGGGGGGAGGSILIKTDTAILGNNNVTANGGLGGYGQDHPMQRTGGPGAAGRIRIEYCDAISGTTNPPASTQQITCYILRQLPGNPNTELILPEASADHVRYQVQYGQRGAFSTAGVQDYLLTVSKRTYATVTLDAIFENLNSSTFAFSVDVGGDGSNEWSGNGTEQPLIISSPDLAAAFNAFLSTTPEPWGAEVAVPISITLDTAGDVFLTSPMLTLGQDSDPKIDVTDLAINNPDPTETEMVTVTATVHNLGNYTATNIVAAFFVGDPAVDGVYLGSDFLPAISPTTTTTATLLWDTTGYTGTHDIYVVLDLAQQVEEMDEDNNVASISVTVRSRPDLTVSAITPASSPRLTLPTDIAVTTLNQGETDAALHTLNLYAGDPEAGGVLIGSQAISVTAGLSVTTVFSWTPTAPGPVDLVAVADSSHAVNEYNEANNTYTEAAYVGWGDPVTIDAGAATDLPYAANVGYGYVNAGTPFSCGPDPIYTGRQGQGDLPLEYRFDHLLPDRFYHLDLVVRPCTQPRQQRIRVDGVELFPARTYVAGEEYHISLRLDPADYTADHSVIVSLEKSGGTYPPAVNLLTLTDIRYCYRDSGSPAEVGYVDAADGCGFLDGDISGPPGDPVQSVRYDLDNDVQYQFDNLVAANAYQVGVTLYDQDNLGLQEHLEVDGIPVGPVVTLNNTPQYVTVELPASTYSDGQVIVSIVEPVNGGPLVSEIWLEEVTDFTGPVIPPTPTPTPTPLPTETPTPTPTLPPTPIPTPTHTPTPPPVDVVDDRDYSIQYDGWYGGLDATALGGGYRAAVQTSQYLAYRTTQPATSVILRVCKGPNLGIANVLVDGAPQPTLDLYNPVPACNVPVQYAGLTNSLHLILFLPSGQKNPASSGTEVRLDAFQVNLNMVDDSHPSVIYTRWSGLALAPARQGSLRLSQTANASVTFTFSGTTFSWTTAKCPMCGQALVIVDGSPVDLADTYNPSWQFQVAESITGLSDAPHTVTIRVLGTHNPNSSGNIVFFDGFTIP